MCIYFFIYTASLQHDTEHTLWPQHLHVYMYFCRVFFFQIMDAEDMNKTCYIYLLILFGSIFTLDLGDFNRRVEVSTTWWQELDCDDLRTLWEKKGPLLLSMSALAASSGFFFHHCWQKCCDYNCALVFMGTDAPQRRWGLPEKDSAGIHCNWAFWFCKARRYWSIYLIFEHGKNMYV